MILTTRAAFIEQTNRAWAAGARPWRVEVVELSPPTPSQVLVRQSFSGICHSDLNLVSGELRPGRLPFIGGHEGAGVVEAVGSEVTHVVVGDHVILSSIAVCGECWFCRRGQSNLCDDGMKILTGGQSDGTFPAKTRSGDALGQMCSIGTFAERTVVSGRSAIPIDKAIPLDVACLVGCGVTTGLGAATERAAVRPGDTVVVWGAGGVGLSAVQGASIAGALEVIAVDVNDWKLEMSETFGATRQLNPLRDDIPAAVRSLTAGRGADKAILTADPSKLTGAAYKTIRKGGVLVVVGIASPRHKSLDGVSLFDLATTEKAIVGSMYGSGNPHNDLPRNLQLYQSGALKLTEMITSVYPLEDINEAMDDLVGGKNIRGLIRF